MTNSALALIVVLSIVFAIGMLLLIRALYEPHKLIMTIDNLDSEASSDPDLSICYFSDLHAELCFISEDKLIEAIKTQHQINPLDMVVFGGDICNNPNKANKGIKYLRRISLFCKENNIPFIGVTGNHDVFVPQDLIDSCGFNNINNKGFVFNSKSGTKYFITGVKDSGKPNRVWYEIISPAEEVDATILFAHNPDYINHLSGNTNIDYLISGHIHGGQIRTPFKLEFKLRRKDELPKIGIYSGIHTINNCKVFISKGIGCVLLPFRLGVFPEVNFIRIKKTNRK